MSEIYINRELIKRVTRAREHLINNGMMEIDPKGQEFIENNAITRIGKLAKTLTESEAAALIIEIIHIYPEIVMKVILDELKERGEK